MGRRRDPLAGLTPREREVLALMAEGRSNAAIAEATGRSPRARSRSTPSGSSRSSGCSPTTTQHRRVLAVVRFLRRLGDRRRHWSVAGVAHADLAPHVVHLPHDRERLRVRHQRALQQALGQAALTSTPRSRSRCRSRARAVDRDSARRARSQSSRPRSRSRREGRVRWGGGSRRASIRPRVGGDRRPGARTTRSSRRSWSASAPPG